MEGFSHYRGSHSVISVQMPFIYAYVFENDINRFLDIESFIWDWTQRKDN